MTTYIKVYSAANSLEAHSLKGALEIQGIPVNLVGDSLLGALGELPTNVMEVEIQIPEHFLAKGRALMEEYESGTTCPWVCNHCGEKNEGSFEICWNCGEDTLP